jgi:hypothetical protein
VEPKLPTVTSKPRSNLARTDTYDPKSFSSLTAEALLTTVVVRVRDARGNLHDARCLLDSGSQSNYITTECAAILGLRLDPIQQKVIGVNGQQSDVKHYTTVQISSCYKYFNTTVECYVSDDITGLLPNHDINITALRVPQNIYLADPKFHQVGKIDMLLGTGVFHNVILPNFIQRANLPSLIETSFGWTIGGFLPEPSKPLPTYFTRCFIQQPPNDRNHRKQSRPASINSNQRSQSRRTRAPESACESPPSPRPRNPVAKNRWTFNHPNGKSVRSDQLQDDLMTSRQFPNVAVRRRHRPHHFRRFIVQQFIPSSSSTSADGLGLARRPTPESQLPHSWSRSTVASQAQRSQFPNELELRPAPSMTPYASAGSLRGRSLTVGFTTRQTDEQIKPDVHSHWRSGLKNSTSRFTPDLSNSRRSPALQRCGNVPADKKLRPTPKTR